MKENYHGIHGILWISSVPVNCNFIHTKKEKSDIEQKRKGDFAHLFSMMILNLTHKQNKEMCIDQLVDGSMVMKSRDKQVEPPTHVLVWTFLHLH